MKKKWKTFFAMIDRGNFLGAICLKIFFYDGVRNVLFDNLVLEFLIYSNLPQRHLLPDGFNPMLQGSLRTS